MPEGKDKQGGQFDFLTNILNGQTNTPIQAPKVAPLFAPLTGKPGLSPTFAEDANRMVQQGIREPDLTQAYTPPPAPRTILAQQQSQAIARRQQERKAMAEAEAVLDQQARQYFDGTGATEQDIEVHKTLLRQTAQQAREKQAEQLATQFGDNQFKSLIRYSDFRAKQQALGAADMDASFIEANGTINPVFKRKVIELAGGDVNRFADAAQALIDGKIQEHITAPTMMQDALQGYLDWTHQHALTKPLYYGSVAGLSSIKAMINAGGFMGNMLSSAAQIATTGEPTHANEHYAKWVQGVSSIPGQATTEGDISFQTLREDPLSYVDAVLSSTARMTGELAPGLAMGGTSTAASRAVAATERAAGQAAIRTGTALWSEQLPLANTVANNTYAAIHTAMRGLNQSRLPQYLDNMIGNGKAMYPVVYSHYYQELLQKGYSPDEAAKKAHIRSTVSTLAEGIINPFAGRSANLPAQILKAAERPTTFAAKMKDVAGRAAQGGLGKDAVLGGAEEFTQAFADQVQDHYDAIERGEKEPGTPFDWADAFQKSAEEGVVGFLSLAATSAIGGHGVLPANPQAAAIYSAAADPQAFYASVTRQVEKGKITPEQGAALSGFIGRIAEPPAPHQPSLLQQGYKATNSPENAVKWAIEQARLEETAAAIADLSRQTTVVKMNDGTGRMTEMVYGNDPETGKPSVAYGQVLSGQIAELRSREAASRKALQQLTEGSHVAGRTISSDELLRMTSRFTPEGAFSTGQANAILSQGPFVHQQADVSQFAADPIVQQHLADMEAGTLNFQPQHANDPILAADGSIIDGHKRIAYAIRNGENVSVLRPRTMQEAVQSAQDERDSLLGTDAPEDDSAVSVAIRTAYEAGLDRQPTEQERAIGLTQPAALAIVDAASVVADLPTEEALTALQTATGHTLAPADAEHFLHIARGEKPVASAFEQPVAPVAEQVQQEPAPSLFELYAAIPEITDSPLWDRQAGMPGEGVTADDLAEYHITGELPERFREVEAEPIADNNIQLQPAPAAETLDVAPTQGLVDYTTGSGNRVFVQNGELQVVNKNGAPLSDNTRREAILEAAAAYDFTAGEGAEFPDGAETWADQQIEQHYADNSNNPAELATIWLTSNREGMGLSASEEAISRHIGPTTTQSFDRWNDRGNRTQSVAKSYLNNREGTPLDEMAREITDTEGIEVSPEDIADFMVRFPNADWERTTLSAAATTAGQRFQELTGFPLDESLPSTKKIAEIAQQQAADKVAAEEKAALENFLENEYRTAEQQRAAFEEAVQGGYFDPSADYQQPYAQPADDQSPQEEVQGQSASEDRADSDTGADEQPRDSGAGEQASSVIGDPLQQRGSVTYYVTSQEINAAGWSKTSTGGIQEFAQRLHDKTDSRIVIVNSDQMTALVGFNAEAFAREGVLHINISHPSIKPSAAIEEAAHIWLEWARANATEIHDKGIELAKQTALYRYMEALHTGADASAEGLNEAQTREAAAYVQAYAGHTDPLYSLANEVLAKAIRDEGKSLAAEADVKRNFGKWLQSFWTAVKNGLGFSNINTVDFARLTLKQYSRRAAEEIGNGKALTQRIKQEKSRSEAIRKRAELQQRTQDDVEASDRLDIANAGRASSNPLGADSQVINTGILRDTPLTDDPVINAIGRGGGIEIAAVVKAKAPDLYQQMVGATGDEAVLADILTNPDAATAEQKAALGLEYTKKRGGSREMKPGLMADALTTLSEVMGEAHTPADIVSGLAAYHEAAAAREAEHQAARQRGRENQQAGVEKKRGKAETDFINALVAATQAGTIRYQRDIEALAREHGIRDKEAIERLQTAATDKLLAGDAMFSMGDSPSLGEYSPNDEREDFIALLTQAAENPDLFHVDALQLIRSAFQNGMIDRNTALAMHKAVGEAVGNETKIFALIDKAKADLLPQEAAPAPEAPQQTVTSIKNEQVDRERERLGMRPAMPSAAYEFQDIWDEAMRTLETDPAASFTLLNELRQKVRPLTGVENALLLHRQITFQTQQRAMSDRVNELAATGDTIELAAAHAKLGEVMQELQDIYDLGKAAGAENSRGLNTRRMLAQDDYSLVAMTARERAAAGGTLTPEAKQEIEDLHRRLEEAQRKIDEFEKRKAADKVGTAFENVKRTVDPKEKKAPGRKDSILDRIRAKHAAKRKGDAMFSLPEIPVNPEALENGAEIRELVKYYLEEGYTDRDEILSLVHTDLLEIIPELTRRDVGAAFSEYGKTSEPSQDEVLRQLAELRAQERLALAYEDATQGIAPKKSGHQRPKPSDTVREMQRKVKAAMEAAGIQTTDPDKQLASALDAIKSRLRNQIADLNKQLLTGEKSVKKPGTPYDAEALALRAERDRLRNDLEAIEGKKQMTDAQRIKIATAAVERSIKEYERRIAEGDLSPAAKTSTTPETPELKALREQREQLKTQLDELRAAANPKKSPEEIALERFKANVRRRIEEMEERMRTGNYDRTPRKAVDLDSEALKLSFEREKVKREFDMRIEKYRLANRTTRERWRDRIINAINLPKGLLSTFDMSAPLRQGIILSAGNPREAAAAFGEMLKQAFSESRSEHWLHALRESAIYPLMMQSKLYIAEPSAKLLAREEQFLSNIPEKIPVYRVLYKGSERAYAGFLNKIRADVFAKGVQQIDRNRAITPAERQKAYADLAHFINNATGRGKLGGLEPAAAVLNSLFFSPRMLASRMSLMANLLSYGKYSNMHPEARKIMMKNMLSFIGFGTAILALAAAAGAEVEEDPRSADFGKMKFGDTRYDIWAGFVPIVRTIAQVVSGQRKSTSSGEIIELDGTGYGGQDRTTPITKFFRTKLAPLPGSIINVMTGKDVVGQETSIGQEAIKNVVPLYAQDVAEIIMAPEGEGGAAEVAKTAIPAFFGVGVQTYKPK